MLAKVEWLIVLEHWATSCVHGCHKDVIILFISTKRSEELRGYFDDFEGLDYTSILRHTPTRWLSLKPCIERLLRFWDPICAYFRDHSDVGKVKSIRKILNDPSTKPILLFLIDVLTPINAYNQLLQVCNEP